MAGNIPDGWTHIVHGFAPVYDAASRVLILGSLPSLKSRESGFYYGHAQNRFWPLLASLFGEDVPQTRDEKTALLLRHGVALWDVVRECDIRASADSSIRSAAANDLSPILGTAAIRAIYTNGGKAKELYDRLILPVTGREAIRLPSTSPANATWNLERLEAAWQVIREIPD